MTTCLVGLLVHLNNDNLPPFEGFIMLFQFIFHGVKMWKVKLRRYDLDGVYLSDFKKRVICNLHADDTAYMCAADGHTTSRLKQCAILSIWNHTNPPPEST